MSSANEFNGSVFYPYYLSSFQFNVSGDEVIRSSMLDTIDMHFERGENLIVVHGEDGMGKSTLLSQFVSRHVESSLGIFLNSTNSQSYAEDKIVIDLYRQASFALNGTEPRDYECAGKRELAKVFYLLDIYLRKNDRVVYLVVDGLSDVPERDSYLVESVIDSLPLSESNIRVLIALSDNALVRNIKLKNVKEIELVVFSEHEASLLIPRVKIDVVQKILKVFRGVPGNLKIVKRLIDSGMGPEEILQDYSSSSDSRDLYEAEWDRSLTLVSKDLDLIGAVSFSISPISVGMISGIFGYSSIEIDDVVCKAGYLSIRDGFIYFSSNGMKLFVREKLKYKEESTLLKIVEYYNANPTSETSLSEVNVYNDRLGRYGEIVGQLSNDNIALLFEKSKSLNEAVKQIKLGRYAASEVLSLPDTLRLSHAESILSGLRTSEHLESELRCYLADDDYDSAMSLISEANMVEERLQLLAIMASHQKNKNDKVDDDIKRRVTEDFDKINPEHLGVERATDLASELFSAFPEMALSLINRIDSLEQSGGNKSDYALFRLSMNMVRKNDGSIDLLTEKVDSLEEKKKDTLSMFGLFKKGTPAEKIIKKVEEIGEPSDGIFILRHWINSFPEDKNNYKLADKLMSLIVSTTDYHANASVYADVSTVLQYMEKKDGISLSRRIFSELDTLKRIGPSIDYVRLQCNLILFENKFSIKSGRVEDLKGYLTNEIGDLSTKLSALSLVHKFSVSEQLFENFFDFDVEKGAAFEALVKNSADHIALVRDALEREVLLSFDNAIDWASRLNTRYRRDLAYSIVIKEACRLDRSESVDRLCREVRNIKDRKCLSDSISCIFKHFSERGQVSKNDLRKLFKVRNKVRDSFTLCELNVLLLKTVHRLDIDASSQRNSIISDLEEAFSNIEGNWLKIEVAYKVHSDLSAIDQEVASKFRDVAIELRRNGVSLNSEVVNSQVYAVDLIIRSFYFLCNQDLDTEDDFSQVCSCIKAIPSRILRIKQTSRLCSALRLADKFKREKIVVEELLLKDYESIGSEFSREFSAASFWALPILFKYSRPTFDRKMEVLKKDEYLFDEVIKLTQTLILNGTLIGDPFDPVKNHKYNLGAADLEDYVCLVKMISEESGLYFSVRKLVNILAKAGKTKYSRVQRNLVLDLIEELIESKFDGDDNISHCGYKICCKSLYLKLSSVKKSSDWEKLIEWVDEVPVQSDKVFILGQIVEAMPPSLLSLKKEVLQAAVAIVDSLRSGYERISRSEYLADIGVDIDKPYVKKFVERAILLSTKDGGEIFEDKRLRLIDSLYSMDKDFASSLSAMVDDDPARKRMIEGNIQRKKQERKEREEFDVSSDDIKASNMYSKYPSMVWSLLGKLNANNHVPSKRSDYQKFVDSISQYSFEQAYPMLSYFIHVKGISSVSKPLTKSNIKPIFDVLVNGYGLFKKFCALEEDKVFKVLPDDGSIVFGEGEGEGVLAFVKEWVSAVSDLELVIIDPYFCLKDFDFIGEAINKDPDFKIKILTNYSNLRGFSGDDGSDPDDAISSFWKDNVSSDSMPEIDIVFCGLPSLNNDMPVHDRWWLISERGLKFGGSMNGIGGKRISSISKMNNQEVVSVEHRMSGFLNRTQRNLDGERIKYQVVSA